MGFILTRSVCTEFSRLLLLILGDETVTFPQDIGGHLPCGVFPPASRRGRGGQSTLLGPDAFQMPLAKICNIVETVSCHPPQFTFEPI